MFNNKYSIWFIQWEIADVNIGILYIKPTFKADRFNGFYLTIGVLNLTKEGCNIDYGLTVDRIASCIFQCFHSYII